MPKPKTIPKEKSAFRFTQAVLNIPTKTSDQKSVLTAIAIRMNSKSGKCIVSYNRLRRDTGLGRTAVNEAINELREQLEFFTWTPGNSKEANEYTLDYASMEALAQKTAALSFDEWKATYAPKRGTKQSARVDYSKSHLSEGNSPPKRVEQSADAGGTVRQSELNSPPKQVEQSTRADSYCVELRQERTAYKTTAVELRGTDPAFCGPLEKESAGLPVADQQQGGCSPAATAEHDTHPPVPRVPPKVLQGVGWDSPIFTAPPPNVQDKWTTCFYESKVCVLRGTVRGQLLKTPAKVDAIFNTRVAAEYCGRMIAKANNWDYESKEPL